MKAIFKFIKKENQRIFIIGILVLWAGIIFFKYGGQSLLIHYMWPFIVAASIVFFVNKKYLKNSSSLLHILSLVGLGAFLMTFLFDLSPSDGSLELMNISGGIMLAIVLSNVEWEEKTFNYLFGGFIIIVCILDLIGISMYAMGHPFNRLVGTLIKPNEAFSGFPNLAANLNILALIPAFYYFNNPKYKSKLISAGIIIGNFIIAISLILTFSRAAWYTAVFILIISLIYLAFKVKKNFKILIKYLASSVLILFVSTLLFIGVNNIRSNSETTLNFGEKISFQSEDEGSSVSERIASISRGLNMALSNPLTGVGAGSFNYISQSYEQNFSTLSSYPYSLPSKLLAEHGFITFILILGFISIIIIKSIRKGDEYKKIGGLIILALLIHNSIDNNFDFFAASLPIFLLIGMCWCKCSFKLKYSSKITIAIVALLTLLSMIFVAHEAYYGMYYIKGRNAAGALDHKAGVANYEKSFNMFFERDARLAAAISSYELSKIFEQDGDKTKAVIFAQEYNKKSNPLDKRGLLLLAKIAIEQENYTDCLDYVKMARKIGGGNDFEIDYYELVCLQGMGEAEKLKSAFDKEVPKLESYLELLKVNAHMTVLTDNPKYAVKIAAMIAEQNFEHQSLVEELYNTAVVELEKFHKKYGIEAEINI